MSTNTPAEIRRLVARFEEQRDSYIHASYKEAQLRKEFIDPMWKALGWDMDNSQGHAEQYKEVIHEDAIKLSSSVYSKAPDYCFRIGGVRKFFLEAKKPAVDIAGDPEPAFQLRSYAWSEKLPLSVLTDFEELSVYDTRIKPAASDRASAARIMAIRFTDYVDKWDEIAGIFSKDAILKGSFDKYAQTAKKKRGTATVDEDFLEQIESWRDELARNIATRNKDLSQGELNFAVQATIDRIVFLRICEDRGIEEYQTLFSMTNGTAIYPRLVEHFRRADQKYNSGLFHFSQEKGRTAAPDSLTPQLDIDDAVLRKILRSLYYPESPYVFSALPADILGQVYEQFLGKVIRLTAGHQAKVEEKPEVKKAGGVYYTPTYIVDYIVKHTIGPLLEAKTPKQVAGGKDGPIRILDPACGSGTFLLQAYQYLLDWYRDAYEKDGAEKHSKGKSPVLYQGKASEWRLTTGERKRILLTHIFGVDIDYQAVEVTKLSLLLKVLEGESDQTLQTVFRLFHERALPDLENNIRHGNSLVSPDIYGQARLGFEVSPAEELINPFDWKSGFPSVFSGARNGFDVVIGNPPYVLIQVLNQPLVQAYLSSHYESARYKINTYQIFLEKAVVLLRTGGRFGYITPTSYLRNKYAVGMRDFLLQNTCVDLIRAFSYPVFRKVSEDTCITIGQKRKCHEQHEVQVVLSTSRDAELVSHSIYQRSWLRTSAHEFGIAGGAEFQEIVEKFECNSVRLGEFGTAYFGIQTHDRTRFVAAFPRSRSYKSVIDGSDVVPYGTPKSQEFVDITPAAIKSGGNPMVYKQHRIGVRQIGEVPIATLLPPDLYTLNTIYNIYFTKPTKYDLRFVLAVLCSGPLQWYWRQRNFDQKKTFPKIKKEALLGVPIPLLDFEDNADVEVHQRVVDLANFYLASSPQNRAQEIPVGLHYLLVARLAFAFKSMKN